MFKVVGTDIIQSDEGFSVEVLGPVGVLYTEGAKTLNIDSEYLAGPAGLVMYKDSIKSWNPPHDNEVIDASKRDTIVDNIRRAFRFRGIEIQVF
jgi:hypothetical protein